MSNLNQDQIRTIENLVNKAGGVEELSKESGVPKSAIEGMLQNARKMAPVTLFSFVDSFDVDPSDLLGDESEKRLFTYKALYKCDNYKDICRLCNVSTQTVFHWMDGKSKPTDEQVEMIRDFVDGVEDVPE
jgi:transcriptional regulator with XRE-family HTH domain